MSTDVDVLVAGAGGAGLSAAIAAAQRGASVLVAEAFEHFARGNNTSMSTSMIPAAGTRWQAGAGVADDAAAFLADIERKTKGRADAVIARALVGVGPALVDWLDGECGIPLELVTDFKYPGFSQYRCHTVANRAGRDLLDGLLRHAAGLADLDIVTPARLTGLSTRDGAWTAALQRPGGGTETVTARAVVLATGGFGADTALVKEYIPEIAAGVYAGGEGCRGDALRLGAELGLDTGYLGAYQGHGSWAVPHSTLLTWATVMHGAVMVNSAGERFGDETVGYSEYARNVLDQPGAVAWMIGDRRVHEACLPFQDYRDLDAAGGVRWSDDPAAVIGCPPAALARTLAGAGPGDRFGRTLWERPGIAAPYFLVRVTGALFHTQGGLLVDGDARVLRDGVPVPGLYAAGGAAAGISGTGGDGYLAGNGLLGALGLGYLAGRHATAAAELG
ncbi:FAD-dependent oxidoreductase [Dactylosporangium sp. CS-033363]|uniref:FAD-dependent oxidoreductase n=1 Tax=Dactylosporangium sp. CS-033363 TaxID=3239935 RepID=UPI003D8CF3C7